MKKSFGKAIRAELPLQLIHLDIYGLMNMKTRHGASYFINFTDDFTHVGHVYVTSHKFEETICFKKYVNLVRNQLDKRLIKALRID